MSEPAFDTAREWLAEYGLLLVVDARLPCVTTVVTGEPIRGSWWGHPQSHAIFALVEQLEGYAQALQTKLVSGKVTFVHRRLWPDLAGVGSARDPWQIDGLSSEENQLLRAIKRARWLRTDETDRKAPLDRMTVRKAAKRLERRLLVVSREIHTESGAHARVLETWGAWAARVGFTDPWSTGEAGRGELEATVGRLNEEFDAAGRLPWQAG